MIVPIKDLGAIGLIKDLTPSELPPNAFTSAQNVKFRNGYLERVEGYVAMPNTSGSPYGCQPVTKSDGTKYWVYPTLTKIRVTDFTTDTDITRAAGGDYTGTADNRWSTDVFAGIFVATNGVDLPQYWNGDTGTDCATLTGWDTNWRAKAIRTMRNFIFAANFTESGTKYPVRVKCSDIAEAGTLPSTWTPAASNFARAWDLADSPGHCVDAMPMGDQMIVYKEDSYYAFQFIGAPDVFRVSRIANQYGAHSQNCIAQYPGGHLVLGNGEVYTHAGGAPQPLLDGRVAQLLFSGWDTTYSKRSFVVSHPKRKEVWICYPKIGATSCNAAIIWNWSDNTFGVMDLPDCTAAGEGLISYTSANLIDSVSTLADYVDTLIDANEYSPSENRLMLAGGSNLFLVGVGANFNGTAITSMAERTGLQLDAPSVYKAMRHMRPHIVGAPTSMTFSFAAGSQQTADGAVTWTPNSTFTQGTDQRVDTFTDMGPYLAWKFSTTFDGYYRMKSIDMDVITGGMY